MALEASFNALGSQMRALRDTFTELRASVDDKPARGDVVLVDLFGDAADDLLGLVEESLTAVARGQKAGHHPIDIDLLCQAITACQERFNLLTVRLAYDLLSYERIEELLSRRCMRLIKPCSPAGKRS
jgi:hypothetical protein